MKKKQITDQNFEAVLEHFKIKKTELRIAILNAFSAHDRAISQGELIESLSKSKNQIDRVSIYRNLLQLKEAGLIHEVDANKYIFCHHQCQHHGHLVFYCTSCEKHFEVEDHKQIEDLFRSILQFNFFASTSPLYIKGLCKKCKK